MLKEMEKQPKEEGWSQSQTNPKHSNQVKKTPRDTRMDQKLQNRENPSTYRKWRDCLAVIHVRQGMAWVMNWQQAPVGATVRLETAPIKPTLERWKFWKNRGQFDPLGLNRGLRLIKDNQKSKISKQRPRTRPKGWNTNSHWSLVESPICWWGKSPLRIEAIPLALEWV